MNKVKESKQQGGCVCGAVRFIVAGPPERVTVCHCTWCQRRTGTAFGTELVFVDGKIIFDGVTPKTFRHHSDESSRWIDMHFCPDCGTNLGITLEVRGGIRTLPAGTFDDPGWIDNTAAEIRQVYTRSRRHWGDESIAVECFEAYFN